MAPKQDSYVFLQIETKKAHSTSHPSHPPSSFASLRKMSQTLVCRRAQAENTHNCCLGVGVDADAF